MINQSHDRSQAIYCSELGSWMGVNPWQTMPQILSIKAGLTAPESLDGKPAVDAGNYLEDGLSRWYRDTVRPQEQVSFPGSWEFKCGVNSRLRGHPDIIWQRDGRVIGGCDIKYSATPLALNDSWGAPGTDEVPPYIWMQCQGYMRIFEVDSWDIFALLRDAPPVLYRVQRDDDVYRTLPKYVDAVWERVCKARLLGPSYVAGLAAEVSDCDLISELYSEVDDSEVDLSPTLGFDIQDYEEMMDRQKQLNNELKMLKGEIKERRARILAAMGNARKGRYVGMTFTRTKVEVPEKTTKPYSFIKLSLKTEKVGR